MPGAVQEMLRFAAPLPFFHGYAREDLTICGADRPRGTEFGLLDRCCDICPDGAPIWKTGLQAHGPATLPVVLTPHPARPI